MVQDDPRVPKDAPKMAQDSPRWPQDGQQPTRPRHEASTQDYRAGGMRGAVEFGRSLALAKVGRVETLLSNLSVLVCLSLS